MRGPSADIKVEHVDFLFSGNAQQSKYKMSRICRRKSKRIVRIKVIMFFSKTKNESDYVMELLKHFY